MNAPMADYGVERSLGEWQFRQLYTFASDDQVQLVMSVFKGPRRALLRSIGIFLTFLEAFVLF